jgi:hypothetical protein
MSPTSDTELDVLTGRASAAGMAPHEIRAWRRALGPIALDSCGCEASAKAAGVTGLVATIAVLAARGTDRAFLRVSAVTFAGAVLGKGVGRREAERRRSWLLDIWERRILEIEPKT